MKKLPIGISTFREIIEDGHAYADKTMFVHSLADTGKYYFLSRPRRFGKSLMVDTLKEAFEGNRRLFKGLWLEEHWDWDNAYPVIRFSFGQGVLENRADLDEKIREILHYYEQKFGVVSDYESISGRFAQLLDFAVQKYKKRVVVLVDEYDKPILDNIHHPERAGEIRDGLKNFYSVIKDSDAHLQFVFITGVSKFSKVSLFSGLNNLVDITLSPMFASICGITERELVQVFEEHLKGKNPDVIRHWYNGYSWLGDKVYNPFSILNYFREGLFRNYWFESGTPTFLIELLRKKNYAISNMERIEASEALIGAFDVDYIEPETLLFQTGYLTISSSEMMGAKVFYRLSYPNMEVKASLSDYILKHYLPDSPSRERGQQGIFRALKDRNPDALKGVLHSLFAGIPHDWYRKNRMADYEGYYASVFYCCFVALGLDVKAEDVSNHGNMDMSPMALNLA
ncbi:ATP-binding protein [Desulfobotulus mexicanus]|uniref:AAA family ATPase n=1 Tax=Desulfobotulus mexicanus TaxID=2586642 RepID=A0A5Q4VAD8_9BACT|nr:ATP-binding protein [Desulfobotulus mexicanus]TYT74714.1 AAA family ATPase [Desulfobotulus mexicanus]